MNMTRRGFIKGVAGIIAASAAPAVITSPGVLMPVRRIWTPSFPMREIFAYDLNYDCFRLRYDMLIGDVQSAIDYVYDAPRLREVSEKGHDAVLSRYRAEARQKLVDYAHAHDLDVSQARALQVPKYVDARILT